MNLFCDFIDIIKHYQRYNYLKTLELLCIASVRNRGFFNEPQTYGVRQRRTNISLMGELTPNVLICEANQLGAKSYSIGLTPLKRGVFCL